jgi:hypothetical protein
MSYIWKPQLPTRPMLPPSRRPVPAGRPTAPDEERMSNLLSSYAVPVVVAAVAVVLLLGLGNMLRGGSPGTSQRLMLLRVLLQFAAVVVIMFTIWAMQH